MSREGNLAKNTVILAIGTFLPKVAGMIVLPLVTAGLTKADYGTFDLITTLVALFFASGNTSDSLSGISILD